MPWLLWLTCDNAESFFSVVKLLKAWLAEQADLRQFSANAEAVEYRAYSSGVKAKSAACIIVGIRPF